MLLGSLNDDLDNKTTPGTPVVSPPLPSDSLLSPLAQAESQMPSPPSPNHLTSDYVLKKIYDNRARQPDDLEIGNHYATTGPQQITLSHSRQPSETINSEFINSPRGMTGSGNPHQAGPSSSSPRTKSADISAQVPIVGGLERSEDCTLSSPNPGDN